MNSSPRFAEHADIEKELELLLEDNMDFIQWCEEHGENAFGTLDWTLGLSDSLLNTMGGWFDHPRHGKGGLRYFPYPGNLSVLVETNQISLLLGICETFGWEVTFHPPVASEYGQGTWKVTLKRAKTAKKQDPKLLK